MSKRDSTAQSYLEQFDRQEQSLTGALPDWLRAQKKAALERFADRGFPDPRHEEWRYTNVRPIAKKAFRAADPAPVALEPGDLGTWRFAGLDAHTLVFVNGRFSAELSSTDDRIAGVRIVPLSGALTNQPDALAGALGSVVDDALNSFAALNTAFLADGAYVHIPRGVVLEKPVYLMFVSTAEPEAIVSHPRIVIHASEGSESRIIEHYVGQSGSANFTNTVTEVITEPNASVRHYLLQEEAAESYHIGSIHVRQSRDSRFSSYNVNLGGRLVRNDINVRLSEQGAQVDLNGLFIVDGRQHVDNHTRIHHAAPRTYSDESYRGVADGHGRGVFKGRVLVDRDSQKIESHQNSANLLLSEHAEIDTKPELVIYADDVVCSHGATVGQLDEQALYYLRSRAIDEETARGLLVFAFADEVVQRMDIAPIRERLEHRIVGRLPDSEMLRNFV
jgi:Fe-S cluster assembly protein SufD